MSDEKEIDKDSKLIKGAELKDKELVRICKPDKKHYGYEWHDGENIDILPFQAKGECLPGGLYFTTLEHLFCFNGLSNYLDDHWFVRVTVDDNEDVWQEYTGKWKAHRVMVTSMTRIKDLPEELLYQLATSYLDCHLQLNFEPFNMRQREELWCRVLSVQSNFLQFVQNQTEKICRTAVGANEEAINWVRDPILVADLVDEFTLVHALTNWSCSLIVALHESGKYQFKCASREIVDNAVHLFNQKWLRVSCALNEEYYGKTSLAVLNSNDDFLGYIRYPSREMVDLVLGQQQ